LASPINFIPLILTFSHPGEETLTRYSTEIPKRGTQALRNSKSAQGIEQDLAIHALVCGYRPDDAVEGAQTERRMVRHHQTLMPWRFGLQDDVAAFLMALPISPSPGRGDAPIPTR
jgi:hypothetical protein